MATDARGDRAPRGIGWGAVIALLRHPQRGWDRIAATQATIGSLLIGLAVPLVTLRAAVGLIHDLAYGRGSIGVIDYRPTTAGALVAAIANGAVSLLAVVLLGLIIAALAPRLGGRADRLAAFKLAVLGSSAFFLASAFALTPRIDVLQVLGAYSLFLIATGAPRLLGVAEQRGGGIAGAATGGAAVLAILLVAIGFAIRERSVVSTVATSTGRKVVVINPAIAGVTLTAPANTKKNAASPGTVAAATTGPGIGTVPASSLQALLPAGVGGFRRTAVESQSNVSANIASADAKGTYVQGTDSFTLTIADAGQPGALATGDSVVAGETSRVTDAGYQRSRVVNGVRVTEKWTNADHGGSYSRTVASRFTVEAQGTAPTIDTLRAAVGGVDAARLGALAR